MKRFSTGLLLATLMSLSVSAFAQEKEGLSKPKPKAVIAGAEFVTQADALAVFKRAEKLLRQTTKSTAKTTPISLSGTKPITRAQTIAQFARLYEIVRPQVRITPRAAKYDPAILKMSGPQKDQLVMLVKMGAVGNYSTLAAGPADKLTVAEFGDSLGFFLARMAQMTHTSSTKYSPPLMGGD